MPAAVHPNLLPAAEVAGIAADPGEPTALPQSPAAKRFEVRLAVFSGPFDLLLSLISKHELDITDVALATVTDEFIIHLKALQDLGEPWALDEASEFLVIAATLLDLKAARLLPDGEVESDEDLALLEARDLLFARLLQYKAFKEVAALMGAELDKEALRFPRSVPLEPHFAALLPELVWRHTPEDFAALATKALTLKEPVPTTVGLAHLHVQPVSVRDQAGIMLAMLTEGRPQDGPGQWVAPVLTFAQLSAGAESQMVVIARFLALLEMFRDKLLAFDQPQPLGELRVSWVGGEKQSINTGSDFDAAPQNPGEAHD